MEGVGARLGRSSSRYGPATVFNGRVRKWKKRWVHVSPSNNNNNNNNHSHHHHHNINSANGTIPSNGNNASHLLIYKWTPLTQTNNNNNSSNSNAANHSNADKISLKDDQEPPRRKFKYIPVDLLEKQKTEVTETVDDEAKLSDTDPTAAETIRKSDGFDEKPDINDLPMEESQSQDDNQAIRQDLNESTLDLSLGLNGSTTRSHDGDSDSKPDRSRDGQLERLNPTGVGS